MIIDLAQREYVFYQELEKSKSPYPGLANFLKERKNRNYHLGNEENIDNIL
jgi:FMN phosphatase YigB (HAD superfamily)